MYFGYQKVLSSATVRDPDLYWIDFRQRDAKFIYSKPFSLLERLETRACLLLPYKVWSQVAIGFFLLMFVGPIMVVSETLPSSWMTQTLDVTFMVAGFGGFILFRLLETASYWATSPDEAEDWPSLILTAEQISNPLIMRLDEFTWARFWYSGDVKQQIREALILQLPDLVEGKQSGGCLLCIRFTKKPTDGRLGIGFTW